MQTIRVSIPPEKVEAISRIRHHLGRMPEVFVTDGGEERKLSLDVSYEYVLWAARTGRSIALRLVRLAEKAQGVNFDSYVSDGIEEWFRKGR